MNAVNSIQTESGHGPLRTQCSSSFAANPHPANNTRRATTLALAANLAPTAQRVLSTTVSSWTAPLVMQTRRTEVL